MSYHICYTYQTTTLNISIILKIYKNAVVLATITIDLVFKIIINLH